MEKFIHFKFLLYFQSSFVLSDGRTVVATEQRLPPSLHQPPLQTQTSSGHHLDLQDKADFPCNDDDLGTSLCGWLLTAISFSMVVVTLPFSLCVCFKVVQEYERAVIFRLGRLLNGGSKGPGLLFLLVMF